MRLCFLRILVQLVIFLRSYVAVGVSGAAAVDAGNQDFEPFWLGWKSETNLNFK